MPRLNRLQVGQSQTEVAQQFNNFTPLAEMKSNWISPTWPWKWYITYHYPSNLRVLHLRNRTVTATTTAASITGLRNISAQKVGNMLRQQTFGQKDLILTQIHRRVRIRWCHLLWIWTLRNWRRIWFCDESCINFFSKDVM